MSEAEYMKYKKDMRELKDLEKNLKEGLIRYLESKDYDKAEIKQIFDSRIETRFYSPRLREMADEINSKYIKLAMNSKKFNDVEKEISIETYNSLPKYIQDDYRLVEKRIPGGRDMQGFDYDDQFIRVYNINPEFA